MANDYNNNGYIIITETLHAALKQHDRIYDECSPEECGPISNISKQHFDHEMGLYLYRADEFAADMRTLKDAYASGDYASPEYDALLEELSRQGIKVPAYGMITCPADLRVESI